jgi:hypothetical protein
MELHVQVASSSFKKKLLAVKNILNGSFNSSRKDETHVSTKAQV